ncbi:non-ribosomal peptide synthetase/type I polyketide synthase [Pseudooceanicola sp.]|uniref:non-ribosomal peptide synthetase/type I polyketide synthase n=1 Tax=Pseudooceanicola sp. TaxID=1914328 RepID=UPI002620BABD|nr:non-ribosomal peptide synthetase/type I polyketide synthase [Pseudooceanicola sp.]MDF1856194.1 amino acid adenylation domain-containing protein [Pseudooceanicola sp.]
MTGIDTTAGFDPRIAIFDAFEGVAELMPDAPALLGQDRRWTYGEMRDRAESIALALRRLGVGPGDHVALYATRSLEAIAGIFGILRLGAIYVPMDPAFALEQLGFIAGEVPLRAALCPRAYASETEALFAAHPTPVLVIEECGDAASDQQWPTVDGADPACILFTSGTTGRPKGVVLPHRAITSMALGQPEVVMTPADVSLSAATIACDGALYEILVPLMVGAAVAVVETPTPAIQDIADTMIRHRVSVAAWYAGLHHLVIAHRIDAFASVRLSLPGGDVMSAPMAEKLMLAWPDLRLVNAYGPTESCVRSFTHEVTLADTRAGAVPIGRPMTRESALLLDEDMKEVAEGEVGQIAIGGIGLALGYFNQPDLTERAFVADPRPGHEGRLYLTGDLGRKRADGAFEFLGRADRQVKMAGRRVEIDGVEHVLRDLPGVADAAVELLRQPGRPAHLAGFVIPEAPVTDAAAFVAALKDSAAATLPRDVFPREVLIRDAFPLTQAGKIDRKALRAGLEQPDTTGPAPAIKAPGQRDIQASVAAIWQEVIGCAAPAADATFFELGGTSLQLIEAHTMIEQALNLRFDIALIFDAPQLGALSKRLAALAGPVADTADAVRPKATAEADSHAIAIVGMAARLPGGVTLDGFWEAIRAGRNLIERFDPDQAEDAFDPATRASETYVPARSLLRDVDQFDPKFFGMRPREAALTDPQGRVFLEICQEALDNAGIDPARAPGAIGLFAGASMSTYMLENLLPNRAEMREFTSGFQIDYSILAGNDSGAMATRVAYKLGLTGPAISINTACSTSLVAIAKAVGALRSGEADVMMAGGVSITFPLKRGYLHLDGGMASPDGLCRPFDAEAGGTVFGHGAGVVVLKRLSEAQAAGDHIHAVIRGVGLNNDGAAKMSFTAPSVSGQAGAIRAAHRDAGLAPGDISYVECHGTATPLGDPVEIAGLKQAFGAGDGRCALGSVKGNLGHLDAAAGVTSVIKLALMLQHRELPPVAHFKALNPRIDLEGSSFYVPDAAGDWRADGPLRGGVSSFGVGGTNAHAVLEEAPRAAAASSTASGAMHLPLSAKSPEALVQMAQDLATRIEADAGLVLADVAYTLQEGRGVFDWRAAVAAPDRAAAVDQLRALKAPKTAITGDQPEVVFLFPGQGAQYPGMGSELYASQPDYARWIDAGAEILQPILGRDMRRLILGDDLTPEESAAALRETWITQPALFLTEFALANLWQSRGIEPGAVIGHSVGEFAAAALTGVMSFEDALTLIARRGRLMQDQPGGAMLSVRAPLEDLQPHLAADTDLAARNAPKLQVVAGPFEAIAALEARLQAAGIPCQRLHTSHAFHSAMMDPVAAPLRDAARAITLNAPDRPIISAVTGAELSEREARDPTYWADQARACVNFQAALEAVTRTKSPVFVEVGPGRTLSAFTAQTLDRSSHRGVFHSLPDHARSVSDDNSVAAVVSNLWSVGLDVDWARHGPRGSRKVALPSYPFRRQRCWIDAPEVAAAKGAVAESVPTPAPIPESPTMAIMSQAPVVAAPDRVARLISELAALLADMSGEDISASNADESFLELGFDSLFMGQVSQAVTRQFGVEIGFRRLLAEVSTITLLAQHLDVEMPPEAAPAPTPGVVEDLPTAPAALAPADLAPVAPAAVTPAAMAPGIDGVMQAQLATMQAVFAQQLQAVGGAAPAAPVSAPQPVAAAPLAAAPAPTPVAAAAVKRAAMPEPVATPAEFKVGRGPNVTGGTMTEAQVAFAHDLAARYSARHPKSKAYAAQYRGVHADPRTAAGFRAEWKELTFPIVADRSKGAYIHDIDGNSFVDLVNGFGQTAFGHSPDFVAEAVNRQLERGFPIGPQADLAGPVAEKFARLVGHERVTFCNTGSEAVMAAMRVARTVTGRDLIVVFDKDYHGQFDEVLVKGRASGGDPSALPSSPGIPRSSLANMKVLPYGAPAALEWIRANIADIAGVIVEPVQSRHPAYRPESFVRDLREVTRDGGAALVMDEIVTGFRTDKRGMQGVWGIQGDMATYGKVVGGGMPVGVLAGSARFMDALDGGAWTYGDDSRPEAIPTFFAGTFVRHPLVLAAMDATIDHMAEQGDALWTDAADRAGRVMDEMNAILAARGLPALIEGYSSWFVIQASEADPRASLLFPLMRMEGVHVMDGFCAFLTTEHGAAECRQIVTAFETALDTLLSVGILADLRKDPAAALPVARPLALPQGVALTEGQREIWMSHQMGGAAAAAFNESASLSLRGALDPVALQSAWDTVIARHDALRLRFARDGSRFDVTEAMSCPIPLVDLSTAPDPQAALEAAIAEDAEHLFEITEELPLRAFLARLAADHHVLVICAHHIVADGWSFGVMLEDIARLYTAAVAGRPADLPAAPSFAAHAQLSSARLPDPAVTAFWKEQFATLPTLPDLPIDRPRPAQRSHAGGTVFHQIDSDLMKAARKAGAKQGCTLFATTFAAMQLLVHRLSGASDIVLGVPSAAQQDLPNPDLVGHCVNFLPIRATIADGASVAAHLASTRDGLRAAFEHSATTLGSILRELEVPRQLDRLPLTEIEFNLEKQGDAAGMTGLETQFRANAKVAVNFDLFFNLVETPEGLRIEAHYNADLLDAATVAGWAEAYETLLAQIATATEQPIAALSLLSAADRQAMAAGAQINVSAYDRSATLPDLVAARVAVDPDAVAIEDAAGLTSYGDLAAESDALAALIQRQVPGQGARVALSMTRGSGMLAGMLAILKAGHAYVPLDPRQPEARLRQIAETAEVAAVLSDSVESAGFAGDTGLPLILSDEAQPGDQPTPVTVSPEDAAYVIFTSGSTGTPKGVAVPHRAVVNFLTSMAEAPGMTSRDSLLAVTTVMFDIAVLELFLPLSVGGRVVIAPTEDVIDGFRLVERLNRGDITLMQATPTLWDMVLTAGFKPGAGFTMLCGGEPLPADLADRLLAGGAALWNMYGPTETTIWSAIKQITPGDPITIGHPIANTQLQVLDAAGQIAPVGVTGELNIGGDGLALGYYNRPDLTEAAFREVDLNGRRQRLYATGDLARRRADGEYEVLGRIDTQVKLRGFRIELGEIETCLRAVPGVDKAAVDLRQRASGDRQLVGYVVATEGADPTPAALSAALSQVIPDYMIPRAWVMLSALPQTGNGKLNRKALPDPQETASVTPLHQAAPPETATETRIAEIWSEVLGMAQISVTDTLFALGIDSLAVFRIAAKMLDSGLELEARHMFAHPSIRELAAFHDGRGNDVGSKARPSLKSFRNGAHRAGSGGAK